MAVQLLDRARHSTLRDWRTIWRRIFRLRAGAFGTAAVLCAAWMFTAAHLTFFSPPWPMNPKDEGYITAFAGRLLDGHWLPYVDAVSHRGPVLYWVAAIAVGIGGRESFLPIRVLGLICSLLTILFIFVAAVRARRPLAGALATVVIAAVLIVDQRPDDGLAYNGEPLLNVFVLGAFLCLMTAVDPERPRPSAPWAAAAGALTVLGALTKQVGAVVLLPFGLWLVAASIARGSRQTGLRRWRPILAFGAGAAVPVLLVLTRYAIAGELRTLIFYFVTYNSKYYMAPFTLERAIKVYRDWMVWRATWVAMGVALVALGIARALAGVRGRDVWQSADSQGFLLVVAMCAGLSGTVANGTLRDFPHYYVQAVPWFALLFGVLVEDFVVPVDASAERRTLMHLAVLVPTVAVVWWMYTSKLESYRADQRRRRRPLVCDYVGRHSRPEDSIYIWGFAPDLYTFCHRRPASRYVYSTFQSGFVPFFDSATREEERARIVPGSPQLFISDLETSHPALIVDVPDTMGRRSMREIPAYADYLKQYCNPTRYDGVDVFVRRGDDGACPAPE